VERPDAWRSLHHDLRNTRYLDPSSAATSIPEAEAQIADTHLLRSTPNPFNSTTTIRFSLGRRSLTWLSIHDITGTLVRQLVDTDLRPGDHSRIWDGRDDRGRPVAGGVYFARAEAGGWQRVVKMVVAK
jgi:hypothetical protein